MIDAIGNPIVEGDDVVLMLWNYGQHKMHTSLKRGKVVGFTKQMIIVECEGEKVRKKSNQITVVGRGVGGELAVVREEISNLSRSAFSKWATDKNKTAGHDFDVLDHALVAIDQIQILRNRYGVKNET